MNVIKLLVTGAAVAAGMHCVTRKRPDGSSVAADLKAMAPRWMYKVQSCIARINDRIKSVPHIKGYANSDYPQKFNNFSPDPHSSYSS